MNIRNVPSCKAENLTAACELIVYKMWEPRRLINLQASMACYWDGMFEGKKMRF
jgi:hypothetical protein